MNEGEELLREIGSAATPETFEITGETNFGEIRRVARQNKTLLAVECADPMFGWALGYKGKLFRLVMTLDAGYV